MTVINIDEKMKDRKISECLTILHAVSDKVAGSVDSHRVERVNSIVRCMDNDASREPIDELRYHLVELFTIVNRSSTPVTSAELHKAVKLLEKAMKQNKSEIIL